MRWSLLLLATAGCSPEPFAAEDLLARGAAPQALAALAEALADECRLQPLFEGDGWYGACKGSVVRDTDGLLTWSGALSFAESVHPGGPPYSIIEGKVFFREDDTSFEVDDLYYHVQFDDAGVPVATVVNGRVFAVEGSWTRWLGEAGRLADAFGELEVEGWSGEANDAWFAAGQGEVNGSAIEVWGEPTEPCFDHLPRSLRIEGKFDGEPLVLTDAEPGECTGCFSWSGDRRDGELCLRDLL